MRSALKLVLLATTLAAVAVSPASAQAKNYRDIKYPALPQFTIPKPETFTLPNGMTVFLMEDHELPLIEVTTEIRTGSIYEPADKAGLAGLMGTVKRSGGTERMTGDQIDDYLAARAASVETGMDDDSAFASMNCLKGDFDDVFRLFGDVLRSPAFAQDKLDVAKVQATTGIARRNDNVNGITGRETARLVYGPDSPLVRLDEIRHDRGSHASRGTASSTSRTTPTSDRDFDGGDVKKVEDLFGAWPKGAAFAEAEPAYRKQANPGVFFVEKSDVNQANISLSHLGITTKDTIRADKAGTVPDYFAVQVLNEVLGGGFASRLFSNVRSKKGLAYNVYGGLGSAFTRQGIFQVGLQTKSSTMSEAVSALREEVQGVLDRPPDDAELKRAKESILNSFVFNYDSKSRSSVNR
jgi:zinc protease